MASRILIVDDDQDICSLVKTYLERSEFEVEVAYDGPMAKTAIDRSAFDLLFLDVMLPGQSGLDLCREFRSASNVPIIMLTAMGQLADKVTGVHGTRHPELHEVRAGYRALEADLEPHLLKEERVLFPMIRELAAASAPPAFHCGSLQNPISVMMAEHDRAGELLSALHTQTDGYRTPADGCASYHAFYAGLAQLETDTHLHVHKENNVLFPAVIALERRWSNPMR